MAYINFDPQDYFNTKLYTGNDTTNAITGVGFQPDWVWIKGRDSAYNHELVDVIRGVNKPIRSNLTAAEATLSDSFNSFDSDGFTLGGDSETDNFNNIGQNYVAWNWLGDNGTGSSNTDGDIASTVSANTTSGFSIVKYTGTGANATVGHGLGAVPKFIIVKALNDPRSWITYHSSTGASGGIDLNSASAFSSNSTLWNNTTPTSSLVNLGTSVQSNSTYDYIMYCFAEKKGFSKFGSYTGNGNADGTFVYTGFKPAFILIKSVSTTNWNMFDNKRSVYNVADETLWSNTADSEATVGTSYGIDILSNGFKPRTVSSQVNFNSTQMIYMAFAEQPLINSLGNPATAR
jgi:hypothetical protein